MVTNETSGFIENFGTINPKVLLVFLYITRFRQMIMLSGKERKKSGFGV